eukprot:TRINITY_DN3174_c0_g1_i1.p1 TRINITY_DN3174_c0_g1~~TRINITY_DN3174_c0_g1_i1.p1  ORF type:complete len:310 (-),score=48.14 TRINITY_DN3174_c0_g1_i1:24-953(-)
MDRIQKGITPYNKHAEQLDRDDPQMAYICRLFACTYGFRLKSQLNDSNPEIRNFLLSLLDRVEKDKKNLQPFDQLRYATDFAYNHFEAAEKEFRSGNITKNTAFKFLASSVFFDVLKQFYDNFELPLNILKLQSYCKWNARQITESLKQGIKPEPGISLEEFEKNFQEQEENSPSPVAPSTRAATSKAQPPTLTPTEKAPIAKGSLLSTTSLPPAPKVGSGLVKSAPNQPNGDNAAPNGSEKPKKKQLIAYEEVNPFQGMFDDADVDSALKHARYAVSAIQLEDTQTALKNIDFALGVLSKYANNTRQY